MGKQREYCVWVFEMLKIVFNQELLNDLALKLNENLSAKNCKNFAVKGKFTKKTVFAYKTAGLDLKITNNWPIPVNLTIQLYFSDDFFNTNFEVFLSPKEAKIHEHNFTVNKIIQNLTLTTIIIKYKINDYFLEFITTAKNNLKIDPPPRQLLINFQQNPPAVIGEDYVFEINFQKLSKIEDISMEIFEILTENEITSFKPEFFFDMDSSLTGCYKDNKTIFGKT